MQIYGYFEQQLLFFSSQKKNYKFSKHHHNTTRRRSIQKRISKSSLKYFAKILGKSSKETLFFWPHSDVKLRLSFLWRERDTDLSFRFFTSSTTYSFAATGFFWNQSRQGKISDSFFSSSMKKEIRQVSISSTFFVQIFGTNVVFSSYVWLGAKNLYKKCAQKTLMKLTAG